MKMWLDKSKEKNQPKLKTFNKSIMMMPQEYRQKLLKRISKTKREKMRRMNNLMKPKAHNRTKMTILSNLIKKNQIQMMTIKMIKTNLIPMMKTQTKPKNKQDQGSQNKLQTKKNQQKIQANQMKQRQSITPKKAIRKKTITKPLQISKHPHNPKMPNQNNQQNESSTNKLIIYQSLFIYCLSTIYLFEQK